MTIAAGSIQSFAERQIGQNAAPHSRHFDRSEAEWRNLTPKCSKPMVAGDLSALLFIRAQSPCHPYRRVPPLEMTTSASCIQSFPGANYPKRCPDRQTAACLVERHPRLLPYSTPAPLCGPLPLKGAQGEAAKGCTRPRVEMKRKDCPDRQTAAGLVEWSFEALAVQHPRATLWPSPPQGGAWFSGTIPCFPLRGNAAQRQKGVQGCV